MQGDGGGEIGGWDTRDKAVRFTRGNRSLNGGNRNEAK